MEPAPLVSIIIPTFNRATFLREAVDSVLAQTFPRWELIIIDDGSTDATRAYLGSLTDVRIHVIEHVHCGVPARLRNAGIARAKGHYAAFLDSDDLWDPPKLETQVGDLSRKPDARWSYTFVRWVNERGEPALFAAGMRRQAARDGSSSRC